MSARSLAITACAAAASVALAAPSTFVPASDPRVTYAGRTRVNADGSRTFDWEATSFVLTVTDATFVAIHVNVTGAARTRLVCNASTASAQLWVDKSTNGAPQVISKTLPSGPVVATCFNSVEPMYSGASATATFTFMGFSTDGTASTTPPRPHTIEFIGDSITSGFGSLGSASTPGCQVSSATSSNYNSWGNYVAMAFGANASITAIAGKGVIANCCDNGEKMPAYWLQTLYAESNTADWVFSRQVPDIVVINLGTNDFGKDTGPAWEAQFEATFVTFIQNITKTYGKPTMPVFVAQGPMANGEPLGAPAGGVAPASAGTAPLRGLNSCLQSIISTVNAAGGNAHFLDVRGAPTDGCAGHPGVLGHRQMATKAIPQIAAVTGWSPSGVMV